MCKKLDKERNLWMEAHRELEEQASPGEAGRAHNSKLGLRVFRSRSVYSGRSCRSEVEGSILLDRPRPVLARCKDIHEPAMESLRRACT